MLSYSQPVGDLEFNTLFSSPSSYWKKTATKHVGSYKPHVCDLVYTWHNLKDALFSYWVPSRSCVNVSLSSTHPRVQISQQFLALASNYVTNVFPPDHRLRLSPIYSAFVSTERLNYPLNWRCLVMQIKVTSDFPDVPVSTDVSTFAKQGYHSSSSVLGFCHSRLIHQWATWAGRASVKPQFIPCVYNPQKEVIDMKKAKHSNLLRAGPFLYLTPAFQQRSRGVAHSKLTGKAQRGREGGSHKICMLEETRWT